MNEPLPGKSGPTRKRSAATGARLALVAAVMIACVGWAIHSFRAARPGSEASNGLSFDRNAEKFQKMEKSERQAYFREQRAQREIKLETVLGEEQYEAFKTRREERRAQ